ncbi:hypothetical protein EJ04DRAFT_517287 [Polyplosphaeria fusca]|uniref:Uncharacterized protein n=1 Tax=Polyplosphaeria fusca TaxID=682080 RepID=A0A9P4QM31_9PLEO|nr:hypothetical protein EJ04DRAFT_517287 [Polyplosphaeria fusca]
MLLKTITMLGLVASHATAFRFLDDAPDGVYTIYKDANGKEVYELDALASDIEQTANPASRVIRSLNSRSIIACGCRSGVDQNDTDNANSDLQNKVGDGGKSVPSGGSIASKKGRTVAFFCNYDGSDTTARKNEAISGASAITGACGRYIAGTIRLDGHPHLDFGYMNNINDFCAHAEDSSDRHC